MLYSEMNKKEQREWCKRFMSFVIEQLPILISSKNKWKNELNEVVKDALELISSFPFAQTFVKESLYYEDYARRISALSGYVEHIKKDLDNDLKQLVIAEEKPKKVGRPPKPKPESHAPKVKQVELFEESTFVENDIAPLSSAQLPTLRQLKWLLSPDTALLVDSIRNIRALASSEAELAKSKALERAPQREIAQHAQLAALNTEKYEEIYDTVDKELATVYLRLKEDEEYMKQFVLKHKVDNHYINRLINDLNPYFKKQDNDFIESVRQLIADSNPKVVARKAAEAELKKKQAAIIKYLKRTDKPNTDKRIAGMKKKLKELEKLSGREVADVYAPLLQVAIDDFKKKNSDISEETTKKHKPDKKKK